MMGDYNEQCVIPVQPPHNEFREYLMAIGSPQMRSLLAPKCLLMWKILGRERRIKEYGLRKLECGHNGALLLLVSWYTTYLLFSC